MAESSKDLSVVINDVAASLGYTCLKEEQKIYSPSRACTRNIYVAGQYNAIICHRARAVLSTIIAFQQNNSLYATSPDPLSLGD